MKEADDDVGTVTYGTKIIAKLARCGTTLFLVFCENPNESDVMDIVTDVFDKLNLVSKRKVLILSGLTLTNVFEVEDDVPQMRSLCNTFWKQSKSTSIRKLEPQIGV